MLHLKLIPLFEDSNPDDLPEGLDNAFNKYVNEADDEPKPSDTPDDKEPTQQQGDQTTPDAENPDGEAGQEQEPAKDNRTNLKPKTPNKKARTLGRIKYGNPSDEEIIAAVKGRKYVGLYYEEKTDRDIVLKGFRLIEPICFGTGYRMKRKNKQTKKYEYVTTNTYRKYLRAFVIRDTTLDQDTKKQFKTRRKSVSKTKKVPYFRMFRVDRIQSWFVFDFTFSKYRTLYNPNDECMVKVLASLQYDDFPRGEKASY